MRRFISVIAAALCLGTAPLHAKSLHWSSIDVEAQLDRDGVLTVSETQAFVFDGDWNGGERRFNVRHMQTFELLGVERIDGANAIPLTLGALDAVDGYALNEENVLRWRSRLPSDPEFSNTALTYRIRYRLGGILRGNDGEYRLDHDFLFPDRAGVVEKFSLRLTADPSWDGIDGVLTRSAENLQPGSGFVVTKILRWKGSGTPASVVELPSPLRGKAMVFLLLVGLAAAAWRFFLHENERGRFGRLTPPSEIDEAWLQANVFELTPEAIGAAWDGKVGAPEVAAAIAALAQERKIETSVEPRFLRRALLKMRLLVDRGEIDGRRGTMVRKLFFNSRKETDTSAIRKHYRSTGLDLAAILKVSIDSELERVEGWRKKPKVVEWKYSIGFFAASVVVMIAIAFGGGNDAALISGALFLGFFAVAGGVAAARYFSSALTWLPLRFAIVFAFSIPMFFTIVSYMLQSSDYLFGLPAMLATAVFVVALVNLVLDALRSGESEQKIAFRKKLVSARRWLRVQLRSENPHLRDEWFPYLLALGLGPSVESWFRSYGDSASRLASSGMSSSSSSYSSSSSAATSSASGWTGGGGAFGGAGASGSWALAAAAVGAGVSAPSSSGSGGGSSSGGGGGGGSSSGGGGGGGW